MTNMTVREFWLQVEAAKIEEAVIASWSKKLIVAVLKSGSAAQLNFSEEDLSVEDVRENLMRRGIRVRYPAVEALSEEEEALNRAQFGSEGPVAGGLLAAIAVGVADSTLEFGAVAALAGAELEGQSLLESKSPSDVLQEDLMLLGKDFRILEGAAKTLASQEANDAKLSWESAVQWFRNVCSGVVTNHAPGIGGVIEDSFMAFLTLVSLYSLYQMALLKRKSDSFAGAAHTATGAMQIGAVVYAVLEERCLRESPGPFWAVFTFLIFMANNITMWPLLKYFKGPEVQRVLFKLAFSFIVSFQGIHAIAWSAQYEWLYWLVMPFWFYSVKKLAESSDNVLALMPNIIPGNLQEAARRRVRGIQNDAPTWVYSILNFGGAVFDNLYMAVYTWRGPAGFWGWSAANIPGINDHLRTGLVKPAFGSLTISVLVFLGTLVYRKKLDPNAALAMNVVLASIGPWLILYYHKLVDWDEPWQPEVMGDWGASPYFVEHSSDLLALIAQPFLFLTKS